MEINGGRAGFNYVSFTGGKYQVLARFKDRKITTETRMNRDDNKIAIILSKIPFIRSFLMLFQVLIEFWKRFLLVIIVFFLVKFLLIEGSNSEFSYTIPINTLEFLSILLIIVSLIIKISPVAKYHAAEHKAFSAYEKGLNLTINVNTNMYIFARLRMYKITRFLALNDPLNDRNFPPLSQPSHGVRCDLRWHLPA